MSLRESLDIWEGEGGALPATNHMIVKDGGVDFKRRSNSQPVPLHEGDAAYSKGNALRILRAVTVQSLRSLFWQGAVNEDKTF